LPRETERDREEEGREERGREEERKREGEKRRRREREEREEKEERRKRERETERGGEGRGGEGRRGEERRGEERRGEERRGKERRGAFCCCRHPTGLEDRKKTHTTIHAIWHLTWAYPQCQLKQTNKHMIEVTFTKHYPGKTDAEETLLTFWIYFQWKKMEPFQTGALMVTEVWR
jgi:hypothetical protein